MVPDKFNMVDMGGIDLIMMQGEEVPGLYDRLVESIAQCRYQCLYNWLFDGVIIPPSYVKMEVNEDDEVVINEGVAVSSDDVIHIYSIEPEPPAPEIIPLLAEENGVYNVPTGKDGFNPVTVDVPSYTPVIQSLSITENGTYTAPSGVDGYSPISVNVPSVGNRVQLHLGALDIRTGVVTPSDSYCYSDLIPITTGNGLWYIDLARANLSSFNIGVSMYESDEVTVSNYIRQYELYRRYTVSGPGNDRYFRIAALVEDLSFSNLIFFTDNIFLTYPNSTSYEMFMEV